MTTLILVVNVLLAAASLAFAVIGVTRPGVLTRSPAPPVAGGSSGAELFAAMYAGRAVPLAVLLAWTLIAPVSASARVATLLAATAAQVADAALSWRHRNPGMLAGAAAAGGIHLTSAVAIAAGAVTW